MDIKEAWLEDERVASEMLIAGTKLLIAAASIVGEHKILRLITGTLGQWLSQGGQIL